MIVSSVMHEMGHIAACLLFKTVPKVDISVFGFKLCNYPAIKYQKIIVLICGPAVNLLLILISAYYLRIQFDLSLYIFLCVNITILIFNLLPVHFMDGGQIVYEIFANDSLKLTLDIISLGCCFIAILYFSSDILKSVLLLSIFVIYCIVNKIR